MSSKKYQEWSDGTGFLIVRAVHIELIESLHTDSFVNAMQRFISRKVRPSLIVSDCGTNFEDAVNEL